MAIADDVQQYEVLMERLVSAHRDRVFALCKQADLTPPQFWALKTIRELDQTKMSPLADHLGLSLGAASTLVDRLVTRGLVTRTADAQDRRAVHVSPSEKGLAVLAEVVQAKRALARELFEALDPKLRPQLLRGLAALMEAWDTHAPAGKADLGGCAIES